MKDGLEGLWAIKDSGGGALVQSPAEAEYSDMLKNAILLDGPIDFVGPVAALAREICHRVENGQSKVEIS
jgi:chemotaxis response regulator CheB